MTTARLRLDVCCNDPDNGLFAYRAEQLRVTTWDGEDIEFECTWRAPRFTEGNGRVRLLRRWWPILASKEWCGNWCWNAYWLTPSDTLELLKHVRASGLFRCTQAPGQLYDNWNAAVVLDAALWLANLWGRHSIGSVEAP